VNPDPKSQTQAGEGCPLCGQAVPPADACLVARRGPVGFTVKRATERQRRNVYHYECARREATRRRTEAKESV
jgi:hypothetical protein